MHSFKGIILFILCFLFSVTSPGINRLQAQGAADCPATLSAFDNGYLTVAVGHTLQQIYKNLDCRVKFVPVPGRRGIAMFNANQVNGEVMRLSKVEPLYTRDFVRSSVPLLDLSSSLWVHPKSQLFKKLPLGYTLGIVWQEKYVENKRAKKFSSVKEIVTAYNKGEISGFLTSDITVRLAINQGKLIPSPIKKEPIFSAPLYHYLGAEFTPFMTRFSDYLLTNDPFREIEDLQR